MTNTKRKFYGFLDETIKWLLLIAAGVVIGIVTLIGTLMFWGAPFLLVSNVFHFNS